jgi:hypothetical protein
MDWGRTEQALNGLDVHNTLRQPVPILVLILGWSSRGARRDEGAHLQLVAMILLSASSSLLIAKH